MEYVGARKWWALGAVVFAMLAVGLDATVLSVALPTLARSLHASTAQLQWFVASYTLVLAAAVLPGGLLGDRFGRKKMLLISLLIFGVGSVACAYATSPGWFIAARVVAGIGAAFCVPLSLSMLAVLFPPDLRPKAVGIWAAGNFLALPIGPILGGWMLTHLWWGSVFMLNTPIVILGSIAVMALMPESRSEQTPGLDPVGVATSCGGLALLTYGVIKAGQDGWRNSVALAAMVGGLALVVAFARWEQRLGRRPGGRPMVDLSIFRSARFLWGTLLAAIGVFAMIGLLFTAPQYFQAVVGTDAMGSGLRLLPMVAGVVVGGGGAAWVAGRIGPKFTVASGFILLVTAMVIGARTSTGSSSAFVASWIFVAGMGMGVTLATASSAAMGELTGEQAGIGSGLMQTVQKTGAPLGAAILGSLLNSTYQSHLDLGDLSGPVAADARTNVFEAMNVARHLGLSTLADSARSSFVLGMDSMLLACAGVGMAGVVLAVIFLPGRVATATELPPTRMEGQGVISP